MTNSDGEYYANLLRYGNLVGYNKEYNILSKGAETKKLGYEGMTEEMIKLAKLWIQDFKGSNSFQILETLKHLLIMMEIMSTSPRKKRRKVITLRNLDADLIEIQTMGMMIPLIKFDLFLIYYNKILLRN
jgi:hypothetical protein